MSELARDSDGSITEPDLHDSKLIRIDFGQQQLSMYFQCVGGLFVKLIVRNIALMLGSNLAEENIILDIVVTEGEDVSDDFLSSIFPIKTEAQLKHVAAIRAQLSNGCLKLVEISPSYGGSITILCQSIEYEEVPRPC